MYHLQTRYYNPEWCRFLNADCMFIAGKDLLNGSNMYAYCYNNPVNWLDVFGMLPESIQDIMDMITMFFLFRFLYEYQFEGVLNTLIYVFHGIRDFGTRMKEFLFPIGTPDGDGRTPSFDLGIIPEVLLAMGLALLGGGLGIVLPATLLGIGLSFAIPLIIELLVIIASG